jgi:Tfp pilus assembly protein PilO
MRDRLAAQSPRTLLLLSAGVVLLYAAAVWFLFVAPKRSEAARLEAEVVAAELQLIEAQAAADRPKGAGVPVTDVLRLAKAMPQAADQAGLVLELSRLAGRSGVSLRSVTPQAPVVTPGGATAVPVVVTVGGGYFAVARFLRHTRQLVGLRGGKLRAQGRLFTVENMELAESLSQGFPKLDATITLNAYVYDGPLAPPETPRAADEEEDSSGTAAAGSTS